MALFALCLAVFLISLSKRQKAAASRTRAHLIQLPAVYHNQATMSTPNLRMLKSDGVFFTFPPRHSACTAKPTEKRRRQGNEPTCDSLGKLSELQTRRGIIQAESVRRIPCRLRRKQATDFMLLSFGVEIRSCDRLEVGCSSTFIGRLNTSQMGITLNW